ncbi:hypothetical protein H9657_02255 [Cellulomonas sp. Sa3CUA2]|uniref:Lipoprotein n=1 Tax=Cellulomonas avistercoris TaxID=2762242 RepID=A0ABR8Q9K8_9CELL|nr:hypothetical protein [Cellulomonas avistercoris]MBD7917102.1 hypothetical protein [Cellulomonas avistercoris]
MPRPTLLALTAATLLGLGLVTGCTTSTAPPSATSSAPTATPTPTSGEHLLTDDIAEDTAVGTLAPSFPTDLVPVPPDAEVLVSSAEPVGEATLRISLNVRTGQDTAGLLEAVRAPLLAAGFTESAPPAAEAGLAAQTTFSRSEGSELLVVGVLDRDGLRTMTLGGTVAAPAP